MEINTPGQMVVHSVSLEMAPQQQAADSNLVSIVIKYPSDWKKPKYMKDGDIKTMAKETAALFVGYGIATYLDENSEEEKTEKIKKKPGKKPSA